MISESILKGPQRTVKDSGDLSQIETPYTMTFVTIELFPDHEDTQRSYLAVRLMIPVQSPGGS